MHNQPNIHLIEVVDDDSPLQTEHKSLGLGYLAAYAEKYGGYTNITIYQASDKIKFDNMPDVIGISSVTQNFEITKKIVRKIRALSEDVIIILGGIHISLMPLSAPKEADYLVVGEGEATFLELLEHVFKKEKEITDIKGIYYKDGHKFVHTGYRELIKNLDSIPFPIREHGTYLEGHLLTSRGCPYNCPFCSSSKLWKTVRFHSSDYVIEELKILIEKHHVKNIFFADDLFIAHKPRLHEICNEIIKKGWNKKVSFGMNVRANLITTELTELLKSINTTYVGIGLETGSERMIHIMKAGTASIEKNREAVAILKKTGIKVDGYFMMGYPGETIHDIQKTMDFIRDSDVDMGQTMIAMPYPGTELWEIALKKGVVSENMDWSRFQADFEADVEKTLIVSDIDRKILFKKYLEFKELWLIKNIKQSGSLKGYLKRIRFEHIALLIREPKKIPYAVSALTKYILKK
jgi:radical SAM superfamily enzyme YgiQ (UPF0313 family)